MPEAVGSVSTAMRQPVMSTAASAPTASASLLKDSSHVHAMHTIDAFMASVTPPGTVSGETPTTPPTAHSVAGSVDHHIAAVATTHPPASGRGRVSAVPLYASSGTRCACQQAQQHSRRRAAPRPLRTLLVMRVMGVVLITLALSASGYIVGAAWNTALQSVAKRHKVPPLAFASVTTLGTTILVIGLTFLVRATRLDDHVGSLASATRVPLYMDSDDDGADDDDDGADNDSIDDDTRGKAFGAHLGEVSTAAVGGGTPAFQATPLPSMWLSSSDCKRLRKYRHPARGGTVSSE